MNRDNSYLIGNQHAKGKNLGNQYAKGLIPWNKGLKGSQIAWNKGKSPSSESIKKMVATRKEKGNYVGWNKGKKCPQMLGNTYGFKKGFTPWNKGVPMSDELKIKVSNACRKKTLSDLEKDKEIRESFEMKQWKIAVFKRDDYRCFDCGERGGKLEADHILQFSKYPRLRFELLNGQTLCKSCHKSKTRFDKTGVYFSTPATAPTKVSCTVARLIN